MLQELIKCRSILVVALIGAPFLLAVAQPEIDLLRLYDNNFGVCDLFADVHLTANGDFLVCGQTSYRPWAMRLTPEGEVLWSYIISGSRFYYNIEADNGDAVIVGNIGDNRRFGAVRLNREGGEIWRQEYAGGRANAVLELKAGGFMICGNSEQVGYLVRIGEDGAAIWSRRYNGGRSFEGMRETEGGIVLAGFGDNQGWAQKVDFDGNPIWSRRYNPLRGNHLIVWSMTSTPEGFALGGAEAEGFELLLINADGDIQNQYLYNIDNRAIWLESVKRLSDGGFILVGYGGGYPMAVRVDRSGAQLWYSDLAQVVDEQEVRNEMQLNQFYGATVLPNDVIVACGSLINGVRGRGDSDGLLVRLEPDELHPMIFRREPEDSLLTVLQGDTIQFILRARDRYGRELNYRWSYSDSVLASADTMRTILFDTLGDRSVVCDVSNIDWMVRIAWTIQVRDFFIATHSPDTLNLTLRRGNSQVFSFDSLATLHDDGILYQWTLTNLDNFEREDAGAESSVTVDFLQSGNYQMEGLACRGESSDNVIWTIEVRSVISDFAPRQLRFSVDADSVAMFDVIPFNPESDSLSYRWEVDGDSVGSDSTVTLRFAWDERRIGNPPHLVAAIVKDGMEGDTVRWEVTVREPDQVGKWTSGQVEKWGLLSVSPNPFNKSTTIHYSISVEGRVRLILHDLAGRELCECLNSDLKAGVHSTVIEAGELPSGVYIARLESGGRQAIRKIVLMR